MQATTTEPKRSWIITNNKHHRLGDIVHIQTQDSRRKAKVIAHRPGAVFIEYQP